MKKMILMMALAALAAPVVAQPSATVPVTSLLIGQAVQKAIDKSTADKAAAQAATAEAQAKAQAEAKAKAEAERAAAARGQVCQDANGCPTLKVSGKEYYLHTSSQYDSVAYNVYTSPNGQKDIEISEQISHRPPEPINVFDTEYVFQDGLNPKDQVKAYYNFTADDGTPYGYTVSRVKQVNDSTYRQTTINHRMNDDVPLDSLKNEMMRDTKAIRELQPPLIHGEYSNRVKFVDKAPAR